MTGAAQDDEGKAGLAPTLVRNADDGCLGDCVVLVENVLDLGRVDVLAAGDDHVLRPADDPVVALLVACCDVAGQEPAVREGGGGCLVVLPVTGEDVRAADDELSLGGAVEQVARLGIAERDVDVRVGLAGVAPLARRVLGREAEDVRRSLGQAVALDDLDAALVPGLQERLRHGRAADDRTPQRPEVCLREAGILRHEEVRRRNAHHRRHVLLGDQLQRSRRLERRLEHDGRTLPPGQQRLHVPAADVELRQHLQHGVLTRNADDAVEGEVRPEAVRVREQGALRLAGRARGVDEQQPVVVGGRQEAACV